MSHNPGHAIADLPAEAAQPLAASLIAVTDQSQTGQPNVPGLPAHSDAVHNSVGTDHSHSWLKKLWPSPETFDKLFAAEHMGNYVIVRKTGEKQFESMPIYVRLGMHLLYVDARSLDGFTDVESLLTDQSVKQGKLYDKEGSDVLPHIQNFIATYNLPTDELLVKDLTQYPTFNAFFARRLVASARPIDAKDDPRVIVSPADCRLTVFEDVDSAKRFWVKGKEFTIPALLGNDERFAALANDGGCMLTIARLAPQDYHRFHSPVAGAIIDVLDIPGELYTVNPQAINENLNVFTKNKRSIMLIHANLGPGKEAVPVALVAVGAMLVGSIGWSKRPGDTVAKGEELGWFAYGGSTTIVVLPNGSVTGVKFDEDLLSASSKSIEMVVSVGNRIAAST